MIIGEHDILFANISRLLLVIIPPFAWMPSTRKEGPLDCAHELGIYHPNLQKDAAEQPNQLALDDRK